MAENETVTGNWSFTNASVSSLFEVSGTASLSSLTLVDQSGIDHGSISGLTDDDHTQYILVAGTRAFTGNQSFGDFNITNVGDISLDSISA
ncbi:MAG: hypothetical protein COV29_00005, partial [Candidatus Yanofskybacteria bacterium CG10_big_fil_rev_8_21_14_0_10_36_16]